MQEGRTDSANLETPDGGGRMWSRVHERWMRRDEGQDAACAADSSKDSAFETIFSQSLVPGQARLPHPCHCVVHNLALLQFEKGVRNGRMPLAWGALVHGSNQLASSVIKPLQMLCGLFGTKVSDFPHDFPQTHSHAARASELARTWREAEMGAECLFTGDTGTMPVAPVPGASSITDWLFSDTLYSDVPEVGAVLPRFARPPGL